jgi:GPH family glycoside/pentoside/hexuronide:cation symporter
MEKRLSFPRKLAYGAGDFGSNYCWTFISAFALIYFTNTVGLGAAVIGTLMMIAKILDGFTDVIMGTLIDHTRSKMGKARPWLFWSSFPLAIALVLLFSVPAGFSGTAKNIYILVFYTLISAFFYTASNISYNALVSLATDNPKERVTMGSIRFIFAVAAGLVLSSTTMALVDALGPGQKGWTTVAVIYGIVFVAFQMITVFGIPEMRQAAGRQAQKEEKERKDEILPFGRSLVLLVKNKYFLIMLGIYLVIYIGGGVSGAVGIYYTTYKLGNPGLLGLLSMAGMIPMLAMLALTPKLTSKWGMRKTCLIGAVVSMGGAIIIILSNGVLPVLIAGMVISSIGGAPLTGSMYALVAEIAEYAFLKFKVRMDGMIYSCCSVGIKVGSGLGVAIAGWLLAAGGFDGLAEIQPQSAVSMINGMYIAVPLIAALLRMLLLSLLKVEKANQTLKQTGETNA